jgi:hypothetical protein
LTATTFVQKLFLKPLEAHMFKRHSITAALFIFISAFGASALVAQLTIDEICHSPAPSENHGQFTSGAQVTQASFVSPQVAPQEIMHSDNLAGAPQPQATGGAAAEKDIDLGETFIPADGRAGR